MGAAASALASPSASAAAAADAEAALRHFIAEDVERAEWLLHRADALRGRDRNAGGLGDERRIY